MRLRLVVLLLCLTISGFTLSGCAALKNIFKREEPPPEVRIEKILLERALTYEQRGQHHKALQAYEAALAVISAKKRGIETSLRDDAEKHYRRGLELREQGKYARARHEFLMALRLWPDFPEVVGLLKPAQAPLYSHYVIHEVKEGEFLTAIAEKYYKDQSKFEVIARFNNLEDATKLYAGMQLKIPEIQGVRFGPQQRKQETKPSSSENLIRKVVGEGGKKTGEEVSEKVTRLGAGEKSASQDDEASYHLAEEEMDFDQVAIYQEQGVSLLEEGQYMAALYEFQKVLNTDPTRKQIREYMAWAHYRQGEVLFRHAEYLEARDHFQKALSFDEDWIECKEYLNRTEEAYKEVHYLKGIQYFEEEKLQEAIEQWQLVGELDSDYKQVKSYLLRAQKLLEKVQELKEVP